MCKLLLSFSQVSFCPVSILSVDYGYTIKSLIDQLVRSIRENIRTSAFRKDLTSFGSYSKTSVLIFSRMDLTIGQ